MKNVFILFVVLIPMSAFADDEFIWNARLVYAALDATHIGCPKLADIYVNNYKETVCGGILANLMYTPMDADLFDTVCIHSCESFISENASKQKKDEYEDWCFEECGDVSDLLFLGGRRNGLNILDTKICDISESVFDGFPNQKKEHYISYKNVDNKKAEWEVRFSYGTVTGVSICSSTKADTQYDVGKPNQSQYGQWCWCKVKKYVSNSKVNCEFPVSLPYEYVFMKNWDSESWYNLKTDSYYTPECINECAKLCSNEFGVAYLARKKMLGIKDPHLFINSIINR